MPRQTQNPFVGRSLLDFFRMTGSMKLKLDETIVPVVLLADLETSPNAPQEEATFVMFVPGTALGPATALLENSSVGSVFLVDEITITSSAAVTWQVLLTNTAATNPIAGGAADKTWNDRLQTPTVPGTMFADSGAFTGPDIWKGRTLAAQPHVIRSKLIVQPGQAVAITNLLVNSEVRTVLKVRVVRAVPGP